MLLAVAPNFVAVQATEYDDDVSLGFIWDPPQGTIDHYRVYVSEDGGPFVFATTVTTNAYTITGVNDKTYGVKVSAVSAHGTEGPQSDASNPVICDTVVPTAPSISSSYQIVQNNTAVLSLSLGSSDNHLDCYQVYGGDYSQWTDTIEVSSFTFGLVNGQHNTLRIRAKDLAGNLSANDTLSVNREPELDAIGDKSVAENQALAFSVSADDSDGDDLTWSASDVPTGGGFNTSTGAFSWTPDYDQVG